VSSQSYLRIIDQHLAVSLSRSYYTALRVIGDTEMAAQHSLWKRSRALTLRMLRAKPCGTPLLMSW
jgi:hypothetical protein